MFAFLPTLGWQEMFLLVVVGLLLYGRNLPQAGRTMGRFVAQMKRGFDDFKAQMDRDEALREVRKTIQDTTRELQNVAAVPRAVANPAAALHDYARDTMASAGELPDEPPPPPPEPVQAADATGPAPDKGAAP